MPTTVPDGDPRGSAPDLIVRAGAVVARHRRRVLGLGLETDVALRVWQVEPDTAA